MNALEVGALVLAIVLISTGAILILRMRRTKSSPTANRELSHGDSSPTSDHEMGICLVAGDQDVFSLRPLSAGELTNYTMSDSTAVSRDVATSLSSFVQAVPSVATATRMQGKRFMEVVINGDLVRAGDGNGWRAFSVGKDGIRENARLFEAVGTKGLAIASAAWQVLAVAVGQKFMADISHQLSSIEAKIDRVASFLEHQRLARIKAAYGYIKEVHSEAFDRDPPPEVLNQLEHLHVELSEISNHILMEIDATLGRERRGGWVGSSAEHENAAARVNDLRQSLEALDTCIYTQLACCFVGSLCPRGDRFISRMEHLREQLDVLANIRNKIAGIGLGDIEAIHAFWNRKETLQQRKADVAKELAPLLENMTQGIQRLNSDVVRSLAAAKESRQPLRLVAEIENGNIVATFRSVEMARAPHASLYSATNPADWRHDEQRSFTREP